MKPIAILWVVLILLGLAVVLSIALALAVHFLSVKEDPRKEETSKMLPNANCGACGYPGCSAFAEALVQGKVVKVRTCKVVKEEQALKIKEYLNSTPDSEGKTLTVDL